MHYRGVRATMKRLMGSGSRPLGTRSSSRPRLRKILAGLIAMVYSFSNMAAAAAGATAGRKFSPDSILEMRVSQNLSKPGGGKGPYNVSDGRMERIGVNCVAWEGGIQHWL